MSLKVLPQRFSPQLRRREPETVDPKRRVLCLAAAQSFDQLTPTRGRAERAPRPNGVGGVEKNRPAQNGRHVQTAWAVSIKAGLRRTGRRV